MSVWKDEHTSVPQSFAEGQQTWSTFNLHEHGHDLNRLSEIARAASQLKRSGATAVRVAVLINEDRDEMDNREPWDRSSEQLRP